MNYGENFHILLRLFSKKTYFKPNIDKTDIPILARIGDVYAMKKNDIINNHAKYNITACFSYQPELLFRKYYGQKFKF